MAVQQLNFIHFLMAKYLKTLICTVPAIALNKCLHPLSGCSCEICFVCAIYNKVIGLVIIANTDI